MYSGGSILLKVIEVFTLFTIMQQNILHEK